MILINKFCKLYGSLIIDKRIKILRVNVRGDGGKRILQEGNSNTQRYREEKNFSLISITSQVV